MSNELRERALARGDRRSSLLFYRLVRGVLRLVLHPFLRVEATGTEILDRGGPIILAPVHRSHLDSALIGSIARRRIRALGKDTLFTTPGVSWVCAALGAIPVRRGHADRDALLAAQAILERDEAMIVFPEGGRGRGDEVGPLFDGAAWLAARTGAPIVPIGIAGTERALPEGGWRLRRSTVTIVVGQPVLAPVPGAGRRVGRSRIRDLTAELGTALEAVQRTAVTAERS